MAGGTTGSASMGHLKSASYIIALNFATPTPIMQHVREPDHGRAWIGSPYLQSLIVSHAFTALLWIRSFYA